MNAMAKKPNRKKAAFQAETRDEILVPAVQRFRIAGMMPGKQGPDVKVIHRQPIAERGEWADPADTNTRSKAPRSVLGYRRADPLRTMHVRGDLITKEHLNAAERLRDDAEIANGARPGAEKSEVRGGFCSGGPGDQQLDAMARYRAALGACGHGTKACQLMCAVVLSGQDVSSWSEACGMSRHVGVGMLVATLDLLQMHYDGGKAGRRS